MINSPNSNQADGPEQPDSAQLNPAQLSPAQPNSGQLRQGERNAEAIPMSTTRKLGILLAAVVLPIALALAAYSLARTNPIGGTAQKLPARFQLNLNSHFTIPAPMIGFQQRAEWPIDLQHPRAIAIGPNDTVHIAGDQRVSVYQSDGSLVSQIDLETEPSCLVVADSTSEEPGRTYIGTAQGVLVFGPDGAPRGAWPSLGDNRY